MWRMFCKSSRMLLQWNVGASLEKIAIDLAVPFSRSRLGNRYLLVIMNHFNEWPEVAALSSQQTQQISRTLFDTWNIRFGMPSFRARVEVRISRLSKTMWHIGHWPHTMSGCCAVINKNQTNWNENIHLFLMAHRFMNHLVLNLPISFLGYSGHYQSTT